MATKTVRANEVVSVRHPEHGLMVTPDPAQPYPVDDPLVRAYPWLFSTEDELAAKASEPTPESVPIETASKRPGQKRGGSVR